MTYFDIITYEKISLTEHGYVNVVCGCISLVRISNYSTILMVLVVVMTTFCSWSKYSWRFVFALICVFTCLTYICFFLLSVTCCLSVASHNSFTPQQFSRGQFLGTFSRNSPDSSSGNFPIGKFLQHLYRHFPASHFPFPRDGQTTGLAKGALRRKCTHC